jgi:hypothetical protein
MRGDLLPTLRKQLVELTIAQKERDARLEFARKEREAIAGGLPKVDRLQMYQVEAKRLQAKIDELELAEVELSQ